MISNAFWCKPKVQKNLTNWVDEHVGGESGGSLDGDIGWRHRRRRQRLWRGYWRSPFDRTSTSPSAAPRVALGFPLPGLDPVFLHCQRPSHLEKKTLLFVIRVMLIFHCRCLLHCVTYNRGRKRCTPARPGCCVAKESCGSCGSWRTPNLCVVYWSSGITIHYLIIITFWTPVYFYRKDREGNITERNHQQHHPRVLLTNNNTCIRLLKMHRLT